MPPVSATSTSTNAAGTSNSRKSRGALAKKLLKRGIKINQHKKFGNDDEDSLDGDEDDEVNIFSTI